MRDESLKGEARSCGGESQPGSGALNLAYSLAPSARPPPHRGGVCGRRVEWGGGRIVLIARWMGGSVPVLVALYRGEEQDGARQRHAPASGGQ